MRTHPHGRESPDRESPRKRHGGPPAARTDARRRRGLRVGVDEGGDGVPQRVVAAGQLALGEAGGKAAIVTTGGSVSGRTVHGSVGKFVPVNPVSGYPSGPLPTPPPPPPPPVPSGAEPPDPPASG